MEPKARLLTFVGYSNEHKAFRFLDKTTGRITISRDAKFLEDLEMDRNIRSDERKHQPDEQESNVELPSLPSSDKMPIAEEEEENLMEYESAEELFLERTKMKRLVIVRITIVEINAFCHNEQTEVCRPKG